LTSSLILTLVIVPIMFVWIAPGPPKETSPEKPDGRAPSLALAPEYR
jgi:hypothetical protein